MEFTNYNSYKVILKIIRESLFYTNSKTPFTIEIINELGTVVMGNKYTDLYPYQGYGKYFTYKPISFWNL